LAAPRTALGGRDGRRHGREPPLSQPLEIDETRRSQPEASEDALVAEAIERRAGDQLHQLAEQQEAEVAVETPRCGWVLQACAVDLLVDGLARAAAGEEVRPPVPCRVCDLAVKRSPRREPRAMGEQMAHADGRLAVHAEVGDEARHPVLD